MTEKKFSGVFANLGKICDFVTGEAEAAGLNEKEVYAVQLAVDEACTNVIEHAYGGEGVGDVWIKCESDERGIEIEIRDEGEPFDPDSVPVPEVGTPLHEFGPRGAGVFLIKKVMDEVEFDFTDKWNVLRMRKNRGG